MMPEEETTGEATLHAGQDQTIVYLPERIKMEADGSCPGWNLAHRYRRGIAYRIGDMTSVRNTRNWRY